MEIITLKQISSMDSPALGAVLDYWKDYDPKSVLLAYAELKRRDYSISERLIKKQNEFCVKYNQPDIDNFLMIYMKENGFNSYEEYFEREIDMPKKVLAENFLKNIDSNRAISSNDYNKYPSADNMASSRQFIPILFAIVIIFFFFNFFTVSCGGQKIAGVTGINLVTGTELKDRDLFTGEEKEGEKIPSSAWAIIAFGAAIVGLGAFLIKDKKELLIGTGAGAVGFGSLLILQFAIKSAIEEKAKGGIQTDFEFGYWAALIAMGAAGIISYLRNQEQIGNEKITISTHDKGYSSFVFCQNCGKKQVENSKFCQNCGIEL